MELSSRFASPTSGFDVDELLGQLRKIFWLSLGLAVVLLFLRRDCTGDLATERHSAAPWASPFGGSPQTGSRPVGQWH